MPFCAVWIVGEAQVRARGPFQLQDTPHRSQPKSIIPRLPIVTGETGEHLVAKTTR